MKCITTHKKIREIGGALETNDIFPTMSLYFHPSPSQFGHSLPMKFMFLEWARFWNEQANNNYHNGEYHVLKGRITCEPLF